MPEHLIVEVVDPEVARTTAADDGASRRSLLRRAVFAGGSILAGGVLISGLPSLASGAPSKAQDAEILNFALLLEYLEAAFYADALDKGALEGATGRFAEVVGAHEAAHVDFLKGALGDAAIATPTFDFKNTTGDADMFRATAIVLEDTGVMAYNGQGPNLTKPTLDVAATIVSVEARHAAWARGLVGQNPAPDAFNPAMTKQQITDAVGATGFITAA